MNTCTIDETVSQANLFCQSCNRGYMLLKRRHLCHPDMPPCPRRRTEYAEKYIIGAEYSNDYHIAYECAQCKESREWLTTPREGRCPKCEFTGRYIQDEDGVCPACKCADAPAKTRAPKVRAVPRMRTQVDAPGPIIIPKPKMTLYAEIGAANMYNPEGGAYSLHVRGIPTSAIPTKKWVEWAYNALIYAGELSDDFYVRAITYVDAQLTELRAEYDVTWDVQGLTRVWLQHMCSVAGVSEWV